MNHLAEQLLHLGVFLSQEEQEILGAERLQALLDLLDPVVIRRAVKLLRPLLTQAMLPLSEARFQQVLQLVRLPEMLTEEDLPEADRGGHRRPGRPRRESLKALEDAVQHLLLENYHLRRALNELKARLMQIRTLSQEEV